MAQGVSFPYPTFPFVSFLSLTTRTPNCHKAIQQDGALPLSGYTPTPGILGTKQEPQGSFRKKNLWTLLGKDQASLSCKAPPSPSQALMGFLQVLKGLLKPSELLTRHTAGGSWRVFPDSRHGGSRMARRSSKAQAAQPQPTPSKAMDCSSMGWGIGKQPFLAPRPCSRLTTQHHATHTTG